MNRGNVTEWIHFITQLRADVNDVALYNAPINVKYISPDIQKEIFDNDDKRSVLADT
ncbi:hypothetical protein LINPERPRIM_LOCUS18773 [Linum perenne]